MIEILVIIFPMIAIGVGAILVINHLKTKAEAERDYEDTVGEDYMALGMCLGMCFGVAVSSVFASLLGKNYISYVTCFGMLGGMLIGMSIKKK